MFMLQFCRRNEVITLSYNNVFIVYITTYKTTQTIKSNVKSQNKTDRTWEKVSCT